MNKKYGFGKQVPYSFEIAIQKVTEALQTEGFGILTEIDAAATIKKKLNLDMPSYRILGACNPTLAHRALEIEPNIGLLLPCNVVVRKDINNQVYVEFMDPSIISMLESNPALVELSQEVKQKLERVMQTL
ncbi:MAG: DUF302 domain-containing protein [Candidatus Berkiella sp.]